MKASVATLFVLSALALVSAVPNYEQQAELINDDGRGWQTWTALQDWVRPATNYITNKMPDKTPLQFANDVKDAAVDFQQRAQDHPVVEGVGNVVRPVHQWVKEKANNLGQTSFRDMFDSAKGYVQSADRRVAGWFRDSNGRLQQLPLGEDIEILH